MKPDVKGFLCALLIFTFVFSMFTVSGVAAFDFDTNEECQYRTGDLGINQQDLVTPVISTAEDYYNYADITEDSLVAVGADVNTSTLPESVDNSNSPYFPEVGDQGALNSCVVFATTYYQFTYAMNKYRNVVTTPDNTFSVKWIYNLVNYGLNEGTTAFSIYNLLTQHGCPSAKTLPYDGVDFKSWSTDASVWREAMRYRVKDYQQFKDIGKTGSLITSPDDPDLTVIKTALSNGDILKFTSYIYSWEFSNIKTNPNVPENDKYADQKFVYEVSGYEGGHGMAIVGYNDKIWFDINGNNLVDKGETGGLKIVNSWGAGWGNDGFMWIPYDALNDVSCVEGFAHTETRQPAIEDVYRIDVYERPQKDIYLKLTLNTADRTQFSVRINADKNGSEYQGYLLGEANYFMPDNNYAFDGTTTACDATFVYPLDDMDPEINNENLEQYNIKVTFKDNNADSKPLYVKSVSVVNEHTGKEYKLNADYPISVDGSEYTTSVIESTKTNATIYYIGFDNPTLNYVTPQGNVESVKMQENAEKHGALYKHVIYDITDDVSLWFTDDSGKIDNNGGANYTATEGLNYYYTKGQREPLTLVDFDFANGTPDVNKRCLIDAEVTGGYEEYKFKYTMENLDTGEIKEFDFDYNYFRSPYSFLSEAKYKITVEVMDYAKETSKLSKTIEVKNHPFCIDTITLDREAVLVSKPVQFISTTAFEVIASYGGYSAKSRFVITDSSGKTWCDEVVKYSTYDTSIKTTTTVYTFTPEKAGNYTLTVSSEDANKEYAEKTITFTVYDMHAGDANGDGSVSVKDATAIQKYIAGLEQNSAFMADLADCDTNKTVTIKDATCIRKYLANMPNSFEAGKVIGYIPPVTEPETTAPTEPATTTPEARVVTFTNSHKWSGTIYCYYWSDSNMNMTSWPGESMAGAGTNSFGEALLTFDVPEGATYVIFTNGALQTVDIPYSGGDVKFYPLSETDTNGHYKVANW